MDHHLLVVSMKIVIPSSSRSTKACSIVQNTIVGGPDVMVGCLVQSSANLDAADCSQYRKAETLLPIIQRWIRPGSRIISDDYRAYDNISTIDGGIYTHDVVKHSENFVHPQDPNIHTQTIEGLWMHAKKKMRRQNGTSRELFNSYLSEFIWRYEADENLFRSALVLISKFYA